MTLGGWFDYVAGGKWLPFGLAPEWPEGPEMDPETGEITPAPTASIEMGILSALGLYDPQTGERSDWYQSFLLGAKYLQAGGKWRLLEPKQKSAIITALLIAGGLTGIVLTVALLPS